ncbi:MAG: GNAT family N-acetyltransferase [Anaerolineae bacterium]|nr:GNAT family N-acetyltransferase [Anaerolineae bacterium]
MTEIRSRYFPLQLPANVTARVVDKQTVFEVNRMTGIFRPSELGLYEPPPERQKRIGEVANQFVHPAAEAIAFYDDKETPVGWFWGYMEDTETFTIDTFGLVTAYRGNGIYRAFSRVLLAYLQEVGYERVTVCTHPNNRAMLIANLKLGFSIAGMELNARSGALVKLVYQLHPDRRADFARAFRLLPDDSPEAQL